MCVWCVVCGGGPGGGGDRVPRAQFTMVLPHLDEALASLQMRSSALVPSSSVPRHRPRRRTSRVLSPLANSCSSGACASAISCCSRRCLCRFTFCLFVCWSSRQARCRCAASAPHLLLPGICLPCNRFGGCLSLRLLRFFTLASSAPETCTAGGAASRVTGPRRVGCCWGRRRLGRLRLRLEGRPARPSFCGGMTTLFAQPRPHNAGT